MKINIIKIIFFRSFQRKILSISSNLSDSPQKHARYFISENFKSTENYLQDAEMYDLDNENEMKDYESDTASMKELSREFGVPEVVSAKNNSRLQSMLSEFDENFNGYNYNNELIENLRDEEEIHVSQINILTEELNKHKSKYAELESKYKKVIYKNNLKFIF